MYKIYRIQNELLTAQISNHGAELKSVISNESNFEFIWQNNNEVWGRSAPILFPIIGREIENIYKINGKNYPIPQHGFARDSEFECEFIHEDEICFKLNHNNIDKSIYPFRFSLYINFRLKSNELIQEFKVVNEDDKKIYFSIGGHPAFKLPEKSFSSYELSIPNNFLNNKILKTYDNLLSDEFQLPNLVNHYATIDLDFKDGVKILELNGLSLITLKSLNDRYSITMKIPNFENLGIWAPHNFYEFICLEPWMGITGSLIKSKTIENKKGIIKLDTEKEYKCFFSIIFTHP